MSQNNNVDIPSLGTLNLDQPVELQIPMPWGYVAAKAWGNPESKKPILGLHGWMDNAGTFDRLVPRLSNSLYFVAVDLPGHGLSSHLPPGIQYHFLDFLTVIRRITNYLKWSKFSIVGHSMGAGLGVYFSTMYPNVVDRLVMLDMIKPMSSEDGPTGDSMSQSIDQFLSVESKLKPDQSPSYSFQDATQRYITATDNSLTKDAAKCLMARGAVRVEKDKDQWIFTRDLRLRNTSLLRFSHEASLRFLEDVKCHNLLIKAIDAPTFMPDEIINRTLAIYRQKCASFQYIEVEGNHFVHLNEPEKISDIVNQHLLAGNSIKSGL